MNDTLLMKALFLGGAVVYKKDKNNNKTEEVQSYAITLAEVFTTKENVMFVKTQDKFIDSSCISVDDFKALKAFDLLQLEVSVRSLTSDPKIVKVFKSEEKDNKLTIYY